LTSGCVKQDAKKKREKATEIRIRSNSLRLGFGIFFNFLNMDEAM
jgi:hypothetical protein